MSAHRSPLSAGSLRLAVIQIAPVFLDAWATWDKLKSFGKEAVADGAEVITWGETLIPGYPGWISIDTSKAQVSAYARYWDQAVTLDGPLIADMCAFAKEHGVVIIGGVAERESGSTYSTIVTIGGDGEILGRHRKLKPTWRERLVWADGDGEGLRTYETKVGRIGSLNCWENWMPLARAALYQQEQFVHVGLWPGNQRLVEEITRFIALESRSWSVAACGLLRPDDIAHLDGEAFPIRKEMMTSLVVRQDGGSRIVDPGGDVVAGPLVGEEGIIAADLDATAVVRSRQIFDASGHYSRPDVLRLLVGRSEAKVQS